MPLTHFPNGISVQAASASNSNSGAGDLDCNNLYVGGTAIGQTQMLQYTFGSASTAETAYLAVPFAGNITKTFVTIGATSAIAAAYTVRIGSAGTVAVASVNNTNTLNGSQQALTTTTVAVTTASGITVVRGVQGTAGSSTIGVVIKRTS